jgi:hypothetical protein
MKEIIFYILHYLIGLIIVSFLLWIIIYIHNYFSKENIPLEQILNFTKLSS